MATEFKLPELGENVESGNVVSVLVKEGDSVSIDEPVLEIETDKAVIEVPSGVAGTIQKIHVKAGQTASVGQVILTVDGAGGAAPAKKEEKKEKKEPAVAAAPVKAEPAPQEPVPEKPAVEAPAPVAEEPAAETRKSTVTVLPTPEPAERESGHPAPASPSVRRFARELGLDVERITGTGPGGRISMEDVKNFSKRINAPSRGGVVALPSSAVELPVFEKWGAIERQPMTNIRRVTAERMSQAWASVPHVTQFDKADISRFEEERKRYAKQMEAAGGKLTITAVLVKVVASALKVFPQFNASVDMKNREIIFKKYFNIGVAVDTERGLLVPVLRDADRKNIIQIAVELAELAEKARKGKLSPSEMQGGSMTITNLGGIGGSYFTPIVNAPEVAILAVSRAQVEPVYQDGDFVPRTMLPLGLSYDHRLIDGADGARFLRWAVTALEDPFLMSLEG